MLGKPVSMASNRVPLSVVIITRDAATQIVPCLKSAAFADEIVVVDSGSSDDTVALAIANGARVVSHEWQGFGKQKQYAVTQAQHDWVLCLDADERVTDELLNSIEATLRLPEFNAYKMPRRNRFMGRYLRHGEGYPDWSLRLFHRAHASWSDDTVHEKVETLVSVGILKGDLLHESEQGIADYLHKQNGYTTIQAQELHRTGVRADAAKLLLSPLVRFFKFYVLRRGFLDGVPGLIHILIGCFNTFSKYAKLIEHNRGAG
jgi:glycosyltransferase involved in cell wall biosynthesis